MREAALAVPFCLVRQIQVFGVKEMVNEELFAWDEEVLDDHVEMEDPLDLIIGFVDSTLAKSFFSDSYVEPAAPARDEQFCPSQRFCCVITKNKSSSWAEDLADFTSIAEQNRVYN